MSVEALTADGIKIVLATAVGPSSNTVVSAGGAANIDLAVQPNPAVIRKILGFTSVSGLPDGVVLEYVTYPDIATVRVRVFNPTGSDKTVTANSVTATILAKAS
jgi:hypothetical protein